MYILSCLSYHNWLFSTKTVVLHVYSKAAARVSEHRSLWHATIFNSKDIEIIECEPIILQLKFPVYQITYLSECSFS